VINGDWILKLLFCSFSTILLVGLINLTGYTATFEWDGDSDTSSWTIAANWDDGTGSNPSEYPGENRDTDVVIITNTLTAGGSPFLDPWLLALPDGVTIASLTIDADSAGDVYLLIQDSGNTFTITGALDVDAGGTAASEDVTITIEGTLNCGSVSLTGGTNGAVATLNLNNDDAVLDVDGNLTLAVVAAATDALLDSTGVAATINVGGDFDVADGTFTCGTSTVTMTGTGNLDSDTQTIYNFATSGTGTITAVTNVDINGTLSVGANTTLDADTNDAEIDVAGTTTISGTLLVGANDPVVGAAVTINSGGALTCNTTDAWTPGQNIIINGALTWNCSTKLTLASLVVGSGGNAVLSNTGEIEVTGTSSLNGTVTMSGAGTLDFDDNVTIAGTGGITVSADGAVEVDDDIDNSAGGNINMTAGTIIFDGGDAAEYTVGSGTNTLNTVNVAAATPLTISGSEGTLNIDGTLTPAENTADITGGSNVTVTFSGDIDLSSNADLQLSGPVNFDSSATITLGTGTISFGNSSNDITIDDPDSTDAVVLTITDGGSGGLITFAGDVYIGYGNDTTTDKLTCAQGDVTINVGAGRTITADAGAVNITGPDGLFVNGRVGIGTTNPDPAAA